MALFMFALAGIPPTAGFFGKLAIFSSAIHAGRIAVVVVAVLASAVGAYYYLRIMVLMYMKATDSTERRILSGLGICRAVGLCGHYPSCRYPARKST